MHSNKSLRTENSFELAKSLHATFSDAQAVTHWRTRFAPAPTGFLHIGHVVNAIHVWGIARAYGGDVVLRIEDHDRTRCRAEYEEALLDDLDWLGLAADIGNTREFRDGTSPLRQSDNLEAYREQLQHLDERGATYTCQCSRKEIANQAPHLFGEEARYPGTCAKLALENSPALARRFHVTAEAEPFKDLRLRTHLQHPIEQCGDFVVRDRNGNFTYQFAVTVDDWQQDISLVIRGEDLLSSTGRQLQLARCLGRNTPPRFLHHQLVLREDGIKLSKSLGDTSVHEMRAAGLAPNEVLGRAAFASGLITEVTALAVDDLGLLFV